MKLQRRSAQNSWRIGLAVVVVVWAVTAKAAQAAQATEATSLDVESAITEAKDHSPALLRERAILEESSAHISQVRGEGFLPKVSASATHYFANKYQVLTLGNFGPIAQIYPESVLSLDASVPLFDGFANVYRLEAAKLQSSAEEKQATYIEFEVEEKTRLAFFQALGAQLIKQVYDQNVKTLEDHLRLAQLLLKHGAGTNFDVLRVEVQLNEARSDAGEAQDNVDVSRLRLAQVMGIENDQRPLKGDLPEPTKKVVENANTVSSVANRGDLEALDLRTDSLGKIARAENTYLIPKLTLIGSYQVYNNHDYGFASGQFATAYGVGAQLTWNLFDGAVAASRARQTSAQRVQAEKSSREAHLQLSVDTNQWKKKYLTGAGRYEVRSLDVQKSEEAVRLARTEQKAGSRTSSEVLDAEVDLFKARAGVVHAQLAAAEAQIQLELALGRRL